MFVFATCAGNLATLKIAKLVMTVSRCMMIASSQSLLVSPFLQNPSPQNPYQTVVVLKLHHYLPDVPFGSTPVLC
jgi:hypothetical protein